MEFFAHNMAGVSNYPNLTLAQIFSKGSNGSIKRFVEFINEIYKRTRPLIAEKDDQAARIAFVQIWSSVIFPVLQPELFNEFLGFDLKNEENQKKFIKGLFSRFTV